MKYKILNLLLLVPLCLLVGGGTWTIYGSYTLLLWIVLSLIFYPYKLSKIYFNKNSVYLYTFLLFVFVTSWFDVNYTASIYIRLFPITLFGLEYGLIGMSNKNAKIARFLMYGFIGIYVFFCIKAISFVHQNPMGLREIISIKKDATQIIGGGYAMPYSCSLFCPYLLYRIKNDTDKYRSLISLILFSICFYLVIKSLYMTALLLCVMGCAYVFFMGKTIMKRIFLLVMVFLILEACYAFIPLVLERISGEEMVLLRRFDEIDSMLSGNSISKSEDFWSRILLSWKSIQTFIANPLMGIGWLSGYNFFSMEKAGVGSHAQWFDLFACYGIFAILIICYIFKSSKIYSRNNNPSFLLWIILGFLNPSLQFNILYIVFFIIPMMNLLWPIKKNRNHERIG